MAKSQEPSELVPFKHWNRPRSSDETVDTCYISELEMPWSPQTSPSSSSSSTFSSSTFSSRPVSAEDSAQDPSSRPRSSCCGIIHARNPQHTSASDLISKLPPVEPLPNGSVSIKNVVILLSKSFTGLLQRDDKFLKDAVARLWHHHPPTEDQFNIDVFAAVVDRLPLPLRVLRHQYEERGPSDDSAAIYRLASFDDTALGYDIGVEGLAYFTTHNLPLVITPGSDLIKDGRHMSWSEDGNASKDDAFGPPEDALMQRASDRPACLTFHMYNTMSELQHSRSRPESSIAVQMPLARTIFENGKQCTIQISRWTRASGALDLDWRHEYDSGDFDVFLPSSEPLEETTQSTEQPALVQDVALEVPLKVLCRPRRIQACRGNIVTRIALAVDDEDIPASQELETAVSTLMGTTTEAFTVWAVVFPQSLLKAYPRKFGILANASGVRSQGTKMAKHHTITNERLLSWFLWQGAKLHRVVSGGGGWGSSAGALSLDAETSHSTSKPDDTKRDEMSESLPFMLFRNVAASGDFIAFYAAPKRPQIKLQPDSPQGAAQASFIFGVIPDSTTEECRPQMETTKTRPELDNVELHKHHFGMLSESGMSLQRRLEDSSRHESKIDANYARFTIEERPKVGVKESSANGHRESKLSEKSEEKVRERHLDRNKDVQIQNIVVPSSKTSLDFSAKPGVRKVAMPSLAFRKHSVSPSLKNNATLVVQSASKDQTGHFPREDVSKERDLDGRAEIRTPLTTTSMSSQMVFRKYAAPDERLNAPSQITHVVRDVQQRQASGQAASSKDIASVFDVAERFSDRVYLELVRALQQMRTTASCLVEIEGSQTASNARDAGARRHKVFIQNIAKLPHKYTWERLDKTLTVLSWYRSRLRRRPHGRKSSGENHSRFRLLRHESSSDNKDMLPVRRVNSAGAQGVSYETTTEAYATPTSQESSTFAEQLNATGASTSLIRAPSEVADPKPSQVGRTPERLDGERAHAQTATVRMHKMPGVWQAPEARAKNHAKSRVEDQIKSMLDLSEDEDTPSTSTTPRDQWQEFQGIMDSITDFDSWNSRQSVVHEAQERVQERRVSKADEQRWRDTKSWSAEPRVWGEFNQALEHEEHDSGLLTDDDDFMDNAGAEHMGTTKDEQDLREQAARVQAGGEVADDSLDYFQIDEASTQAPLSTGRAKAKRPHRDPFPGVPWDDNEVLPRVPRKARSKQRPQKKSESIPFEVKNVHGSGNVTVWNW
ncbi:MAG: hypothetical protein M1828_003545 [Chrysothrix sp. TS-e1954]|nr:MAG: hypothetical protein M1828_003545 [Chrysothrix sp. TS-e1954]